ncbi:bifunctional diaminohydroxyphosphoribosylaminopyrimidine deaminase/5-amino-6-(5-phosphoribosylamino)uracil reductase RibD [Alicyclobacillus fastidiosus]|uniref:Riboflavin biosynthesis protein RibD n=1 Tax=Alicyclobacillus fastidiosus TaxID=392011 RepID=A0ABY6ZIV6_9BACL|nr:bifunctional diaminohydroxyphosphoribosylaminopyrimidine deaminase/5-amino-6-(5-phosphoribosylamino)uracil reductase RibD [Alicyclobacillus fastidiosus]WAH42863.1 bifunctional diaminohydroxyphosphoribosylaminopyrimidine deaminase/5-amino-6-(5-phosphoribosylamino)uracil reductase RibD [Alicyclobacillus fastidiosus]GMA64798.1 riboflavin biosynthesis protein RibD [Alicyclobacillus fastidiosus]
MTPDETFMRMAIDVAKIGQSQTSPNPLVGAVVVRDGIVVGQGAHLRAGGPHAEVHALSMAGEAAQGSTIYVTLEPCNHYGRTPPCTQAILQAGVKRVVVASADHDPRTKNLGIAHLREAGLDVTVGVLEQEAKRLNRSFFHRVDTGLPWVLYKSAMTLSGHTAADSGHSQYVTGEKARQQVQALRRCHPAIAVGIDTALADDPRLTIRDETGSAHGMLQPVRIVFDSQLRLPVHAKMLQEPGKTVVFTTERARETAVQKVAQLASQGDVEIVATDERDGHVNLRQAFSHVAVRGWNSVLLEGGPTLAAACFAEQLVDEVAMYIAPALLVSGKPALAGPGTKHMREAITLNSVEVEQVGDDWRFTGLVDYTSATNES